MKVYKEILHENDLYLPYFQIVSPANILMMDIQEQ